VRLVAVAKRPDDPDVIPNYVIPNLDLGMVQHYGRCLTGESVFEGDPGQVTYTFSVVAGTTKAELASLVMVLKATGKFDSVTVMQ
jgi:hypothetical protein